MVSQQKMLTYLDLDVVRMFLTNANVPSYLQILCAALVVFYFDRTSVNPFSLMWLLVFSSLVLLKLWRITKYVEKNTSDESIRNDKPFWIKKFGMNVLLGMVWAFGIMNFLNQATVSGQFFLVVITMLLISIGGFSRLVCPRLFIGFALPISAPLIYVFFKNGSSQESLMASMLIGLIAFKLWEWRYLHAMSEELSRQREIAQSASMAKSTFLAATSHDLRQPVHALGLFLEELRGKLGQADQTIAHMKTSLDAMHGLLESLLDLSKLEAGAVKPVVVNFPLEDVLARVRDSFQKVAESKGLELKIDSCDINVKSDPNLLYRIFSNLVGNSIKYTQQGTISLKCSVADNKVLLEVVDTGLGIPEDEQKKIFKEFYQLRNKNHHAGGLGLGLSIVEKLSSLLNFTIKLESVVGKGSRFYFELPVADLSGVVSLSMIPTLESQLNGKRVLVVDNDEAILESLSKLLTSWGCSVGVSKSYQEALMCIKDNGVPQYMIVDFDLDGSYNGVETIKHLQDQLNNSCRCLIISGSATKESLQTIHNAGVTVLSKPVSPARLRLALSMAA